MKISRSVCLLGLIGTLSGISTSSFASDANYSASSQSKTNLATTQIVGGEVAKAEDWPWMTAYVLTFQPLITSLQVDNLTYSSSDFNYSPTGSKNGELVTCGIGDKICSDAQNKVCLIERGTITFSDKALNCENGGGVAAIIYNNEPGEIAGTLEPEFNGTIPVVAVTQAIGQSLLGETGKIANVNVSLGANAQQDSSCGASFLGVKWVLIAAHCVDSPDAKFFKMNVGEYDLSDGVANATAIKNIYIHPQYDADTIDYDIALVELVSSNDSLGVTLASKATTDQYAVENSPAIVAGWGGRVGYAPGEGPTSDFPDVLHEVELNLTTNEKCRSILVNSLNADATDGSVYSSSSIGITDRMICATQPSSGKGSCQGDSGGPLIVQTVTGPQQVGIVSWGIGCAETGYPGVFTRVAEFSDWLNTLQTGIAITQKLDFGVSPLSVAQTSTLQLVNNSTFVVDLSFTINGNSAFSLGSNTCNNLIAGGSCALTVNLNPSQAGELTSTVTINTNNSAVPTSSSLLSTQVINRASTLSGIAGSTNSNVTWYSGGNKSWVLNPTGTGVQSGVIDNNEESILSAYVQGKGQLSFQWSVSSEENEEDPSDPYDALYVYVNNELQEFISGEVAFETYPTITLNNDTSIITWVYRKDSDDPFPNEVDDKAYVRNVVFTPDEITTTPTPIVPEDNSSSGGGSFTWLTMFSLLLLIKLRKFTH